MTACHLPRTGPCRRRNSARLFYELSLLPTQKHGIGTSFQTRLRSRIASRLSVSPFVVDNACARHCAGSNGAGLPCPARSDEVQLVASCPSLHPEHRRVSRHASTQATLPVLRISNTSVATHWHRWTNTGPSRPSCVSCRLRLMGLVAFGCYPEGPQPYGHPPGCRSFHTESSR